MRNTIKYINPKVLKWARESSGKTLEDVAARLKKEPETILSWEEGPASPTYVQLETLAYSVYKRPIAIFFFPSPPVEENPEASFRTLPRSEIEKLNPQTRLLLRDGVAFRISLYELTNGKNPSDSLIYSDLKLSTDVNIKIGALKVRDYIGKKTIESIRKSRRSDEALRIWRDAVEKCGVFTIKNSFKDEEFWGFCLYDEIFPIIYLNSETTKTKQIFTLFHELAHVLLRTGGITTRSNSYITRLHGQSRVLERYCDQFAVEFLVPEDEFRVKLRRKQPSYDLALELGEGFKVSADVIIRRMYELEYIDQELFDSYLSRRNQEFEQYRKLEQLMKLDKKRKIKIDYSVIQAAYISNTFLQLVFRKYYEGGISIEQLAEHLRVKTKSIPGIEELVLKRGYNI